MQKIVKRKKKRKIVRRFSQSFEKHESGFLYRQTGRMYIFPDFPTKKSLYFTIRKEGFFYTKTCKYGTTIRIPKWLTEGLKRRGMTEELKMIEHIRQFVKEHSDGSPKAALRKTESEVRNPFSSSEATRSHAELLQDDKEQSREEARKYTDKCDHNALSSN